ncbi:BA14K family protein [Bradyrhizobium sp. CCBAU 53351]|uniref:BA14K family protein n=1 Tax=Bradyrhizobium sp. CCBAU 53351 TaxID=1325114 RepID=UPI0018887A06|nr:BA14K family protein [Bradyrhizobium sp. CCBAU 53351]QOZ77342.1 BA14K family protein [Bradyrhizobium sp. CCBAU 53351]
MNSLRVLSAAATLALVLPMSSPSFAQNPGPRSVGGISAGGGGGGGAHFGGGGGARMGGGAAIHGGGGNFAAGLAARPSGGNFIASPGPRTAVSPSFGGSRGVATAGNWQGGSNWSGRHWHHRHGGGFWPGFAAGAAIGGVGSYAYYGGGYYDDPYYYGDSYYDEPSVAVVPDSGGDSSAYCAQRYKSYDPASGTYLGYDGQRHPCP